MAKHVSESRWATDRAVYTVKGLSVLGCMKGSGLWVELCGLEFWNSAFCRSIAVECFEN